ncbi:MAG TPA: efflux RND transporter periplasmic adaptor subunit, partial [Pirellula sp.]|nr:efflux RND transporter periplasmic adaptor subunit [Pirellula sp.]
FLAEVSRGEANLMGAQALQVQANAAVAQAVAEKERTVIHRDLAKKQLARNEFLRKQNANALQDFETVEAEYAQSEADIGVSKSKVDAAESTIVSAQAAVSIAQANLELAKLNLQYTEIRAPIHGRISSRYVTEGNLVSGGSNDATLLTTIVSLNPIHCYFDADEKTYLKYMQLARDGKRPSSREVRNPFYLALANEQEGFPHLGHMDFVENRMDEQTGTMRGRAIFPNEKLELTPGLFARARLPGGPRYNAILIPDKAIGTDQAEKFVLTVDENNKIVRNLVTLGPLSHGLRIVRSGLVGSERVVLVGMQRARPGMEVTVSEEIVQPGIEVLPDDYEPVPEDQWLIPKRDAAGNVNIPMKPASATSQEAAIQP